ncbi:MAG: NAD(P)/FAD-dependent oxidoreductase, partial [Elusimicrobia bacterium]|nr:NAD(P)/FAD-dependent oxidoreductase [Elusimicrobiota bacterium]
MKKTNAEIVILGAGVGGYTAAFYAADHGRSVLLVEQEPELGGVCLQRGCIPSKALLHVTKLVDEAKESSFRGVEFQEPKIHIEKLRAWKESIISKLTSGLKQLAKTRGVTVMQGRGYFEDSKTLRIETSEGQSFVEFKTAIIAAGSKPALPKVFDLGNPRIMTSTEALELPEVPKDLLVVGGGYIGMELGSVYAGLGSQVSLVEALPNILGDLDADLARPILAKAQKAFKNMRFNVKVTKMATSGKKIKVNLELEGNKIEELYDRVLVSVGRVPLTANIGLENTKVQKDEKGFIKVDEHQRTSDPNIFAVGDIVGGAMLAHKAHKEARIAVENIVGENAVFRDVIIPAVVFTDPEVAWAGPTENEAKKRNIPHKV